MFGLSTLWIKVILIGIMVSAIVGAGWGVVHSIRADAVKTIVAEDTAHAAKVDAAASQIDAKQTSIDAKSEVDSAAHQDAITKTAAVIKAKVRTHVHEPAPTAPPVVGCVTYGLVRQHDAAALGVDPDTLPLPAGTTDDACAPVANADLADAISDNYAAARANAQELSDLQDNVRGKVDVTAPPK